MAHWLSGFPGYAGGGEVAHFGLGGAAFTRDSAEPTMRNSPAFEDYGTMPLDPSQAQPNSAKAGWMQAMQDNPELQKPYLAAGYPPSFFQQNPQTFTGARPFIPGKDEATLASEQARLAPPPQAPGGIASSLGDYMTQLNKFVTSPIAAPKTSAPAPNTGVLPPGASPTPTAGGLGGMKWDPAQGRFVDQFGGAPNINFGGIPFGSIGDMGMYGSMYGDVNGYTPPEDQGGYSYTPPATTTMPPDMGGYNPFAGTNINFSGIGGAGSYMPPAPDTSYQPPAYQEPVYEPPAYQQPEPVYQPPAYQQPVYQQPAYQQPIFDYTPEYAQPMPESVPVVENTPQRTILSGDDGRVVDRYTPPVEEFLGTPYMPEVPMTPVLNPPTYAEPASYRPSYFEPAYQPTYEPTYEPTYQPTYQPTYEPYGLGAIEPSFYDQMYAGGGTVQYAAAGKFLRGPGDGMSDDIKANISGKQEARLADGEFVVPADVVSHIGNGSSEAGSRKLYAMMDRIRKARTGRKEQAPEIKAEKYLPA